MAATYPHRARAPVLLLTAVLLGSGCASRGGALRAASSLEREPRSFVAEVAALRGLADARATGLHFHGEGAFERVLRDKARHDAIGPTDADTAGFLLAFEFPPPGARQGSSESEVIHEQIVAFYDEVTHAVHVRKSALRRIEQTELEALLAHEITHSLQTQSFRVPHLRDLRDEDARLALNAVLEGDAMLVMIAHLARRNRVATSRALVNVTQSLASREYERYLQASGGNEAFLRAPPLLRERLSFAYVHGMVFMAEIHRAGGFELVNRVYARPPATSEQILHPEKYLAGEGAIPVTAPAPPAGYSAAVSGRVGELQLRTILGYCLPASRAARAGSGWAGDAYSVVHRAEHAALLWSTVWDDEREAAEFESALREYVRCTRARAGASVMPPDDVVKRDGSRVALVRGVPGAESPLVLAALLALPGERPPPDPPLGAVRLRPLRKTPAYHPPYVNAGTYVNEQLGIVAPVPAGFTQEVSEPTTALFVRSGSPVALGIALSEQLASAESTDEVHGALAAAARKLFRGAKLDYTGGRQVDVAAFGRGLERVWSVRRTEGGMKAVVLPICGGTGSLVLWGVWADTSGLAAVDRWLGTLRRTTPAAPPPVCAQLDP